MTNPPCICDDLFALWEEEGIDHYTWVMEETQRVLYGHYASCNHESPPPQGLIQASDLVIHWKPKPAGKTLREIEDIINAAFERQFKRTLPWYYLRGDGYKPETP